MLSDPMTLEPMQRPIYIKKSHQIYDHDSIIQSLKYSNKDPCTGIDLDANRVDFFPCINYHVALLCIEEKNKKYYFHHPYGNISILMEFGINFYNNIKSKNKSLNNVIYLNLTTYLPKSKYNFEYITIEEILCKCPITYRNMYKNCILSDCGILCHANTSSFFKNGTLSVLTSFKSDEKHNVIHNDSLHELLKMNVVDDKFEFDDSDDECNDSDENIKIKYKDQVKLMKYNYMNVEYETKSLYDLFEDKGGCYDYYLASTTTHFVIRQKYINCISQLDEKIVVKLSKIVISSQNIITSTTNYDENRDFVKLKEFYKFPTFLDSKNMSYGSDLSFLNISNITSYDKYLKMVYFVGSTLKNCAFKKVRFSCCVFIDCKFDNCKFSECSLYKTDPNFLKLIKYCKIDKKTIDSYYLVKM